MPRAYSYVRVSTPRQEWGDGQKRQLDASRKYCREHGLSLDETNILVDTGSGFTGKHADRVTGKLGRLLTLIEGGKIQRGSYLIVEALDRLSRQGVRRALAQFLLIIDAGINIVTLFDEKVYSEHSETQEADLIIAIVYMSEAYKASKGKSVRVRKAHQNKREEAAQGKVIFTKVRPAWLDLSKNEKFIVNPEAAEIIRRIFRDVASGLGCHTVANRLNAENVPPLSGGKKSNGWNKNRIRSIIQSDAPLGWFQPHIRIDNGKRRKPIGEPIKGYFPAVVDQTLANEARRRIAERAKDGNVRGGRKGSILSNLFTGIARCGICGGSMYLANRLESYRSEGWLRCTDAAREHKCSNRTGIPYGHMERTILADIGWFEQLRESLSHGSEADELLEAIAKKQAEYDKLETAIAKLTEDFTESPLPAISRQLRTLAERQAAIEPEIEELRKQEAEARLRIDHNPLHEKERLLSQMKSKDPGERLLARTRIAAALRDTIKRIDCFPDRTFSIPCGDLHELPANTVASSIANGIANSLLPIPIEPTYQIKPTGGHVLDARRTRAATDYIEYLARDERIEITAPKKWQQQIRRPRIVVDPNLLLASSLRISFDEKSNPVAVIRSSALKAAMEFRIPVDSYLSIIKHPHRMDAAERALNATRIIVLDDKEKIKGEFRAFEIEQAMKVLADA